MIIEHKREIKRGVQQKLRRADIVALVKKTFDFTKYFLFILYYDLDLVLNEVA